MKINFDAVKQGFKSVLKVVDDHSPEILTGIGVAGFVTTTVLAVRVTPKAIENIDNEKTRRKHEMIEYLGDDVDEEIKELRIRDAMKLTPIDYIRVTWKEYLPVVIAGTASTVCILGASRINIRRNATLAAACTLSESRFSEYKSKVKELIGDKKEQNVRDEIAKDRIDADPVCDEDVVHTNKGETLCYDALSGRYFYSDIDEIKRSINLLNHQLLYDETVSLNDLYDLLGLEPNKTGEDFGWNRDMNGLVEPSFSSQLASNGVPCVVLDFIEGPFYTGYSYHRPWAN